MDRKPSLQSTLHKTKWGISTSMHITHVLANKQFVSHKHGLAQLIRATMPDVPNQTPMPHLSKQMLNVCPIPPMHSPCPQLEMGNAKSVD